MKRTRPNPKNRDHARELAALARLITYARQTARDLNAGLSAYCLDVALAAALEELEDAGVDLSIVANDICAQESPGRIH